MDLMDPMDPMDPMDHSPPILPGWFFPSFLFVIFRFVRFLPAAKKKHKKKYPILFLSPSKLC
jgi:hypothetical protein